jgi:hypothetical protein
MIHTTKKACRLKERPKESSERRGTRCREDDKDGASKCRVAPKAKEKRAARGGVDGWR